jgi:hypothetical protein
MPPVIVVVVLAVVVVLSVLFAKGRGARDPREELKRLAERVAAIPDPADMLKKAQVTILKAQAKLLSRLPEIEGSSDRKLATLSTCEQTINVTAQTLGESDTSVRLLRKMLSLARRLAREG